jgi:hypothetical protein
MSGSPIKERGEAPQPGQSPALRNEVLSGAAGELKLEIRNMKSGHDVSCPYRDAVPRVELRRGNYVFR